MYCENCGQKLPDTAKFCVNCGLKVITKPIAQNIFDINENRNISDENDALNDNANGSSKRQACSDSQSSTSQNLDTNNLQDETAAAISQNSNPKNETLPKAHVDITYRDHILGKEDGDAILNSKENNNFNSTSGSSGNGSTNTNAKTSTISNDNSSNFKNQSRGNESSVTSATTNSSSKTQDSSSTSNIRVNVENDDPLLKSGTVEGAMLYVEKTLGSMTLSLVLNFLKGIPIIYFANLYFTTLAMRRAMRVFQLVNIPQEKIYISMVVFCISAFLEFILGSWAYCVEKIGFADASSAFITCISVGGLIDLFLHIYLYRNYSIVKAWLRQINDELKDNS